MIYGAGIALGRLAGFIMLPIYTRFLTPADYGILELLSITVDVLGTIAAAGLSSAVFKFYADADTQRDKDTVVTTAWIALTVLTGLMAALGMLAAPWLTRVALGPGGRPEYFRLFFLIYLFQTVESIPLLYLRARNRSVAFTAANVAKLVLTLGLNIYFVVVLQLGVRGVLYSGVIAGGVSCTALSIYLVHSAGARVSRDWIRSLVRFGAPMVPWYLGNFVIVFSDRYFLKHFAGTSDVGVYSLAYRFAMLVTMFGFRPFFLVWGPQRFEIIKRPDGVAITRRVFCYMNLILGSAALLIALFSGEIIRIMAAPSFHAAARLVPILVGAQVLYHLVAFSNFSMLYAERTNILGRLSGVTAAVVLACNLALIPRFGVLGAALATLLAYGVRFLLVLGAAQRVYRLEYGWGTVARTYLCLLLALAVKLAVPIGGLVASLAMSTALALFTAGLLYVWVLDDSERAYVRSLPRVVRERARGLSGRRSGRGVRRS